MRRTSIRKCRPRNARRQFIEPLEIRLVLDSTVVFNELMYNPGLDQELEWIELHNEMAVDMDISNWRIDGIGFQFDEGTVLPASGFLVVAKSPEKLKAETGFETTFGPYPSRLSNAGETIRLVNNSGRTMDEISFDDESPWPIGADGSGASLAKIDPDGGTQFPVNWKSSTKTRGTPGEHNFPTDVTPDKTEILAIDQIWQFDDSGREPVANWQTADFDPSDPNGDGDTSDAWKSGPGILGHAEQDVDFEISTPVDSNPVTHYFRTEFEFTGELDSIQITLDAIVDDGAVIYLNGTEVTRINMPSGPVNAQTLAISSIDQAEFSNDIELSAEYLVQGVNVLAVEVHQAAEELDAVEPSPNILRIDARSTFQLTWNGNDGEHFNILSPPLGAFVPDNVAQSDQGAVAFASSDLGPEIGVDFHRTENLNDGLYGNSNSWIGGDNNPFAPVSFAGVRFAEMKEIESIAWGRDNGNNFSDACGGQCEDRSLGDYTLQFTRVDAPNALTPDTDDAATGWQSIGTVRYLDNEDREPEGGFTSFLRHEFDVRQEGRPIRATGIRIIVPQTGLGNGTAIDEIEAYEKQTSNDVVFGARLFATELPQEPARLRFNELGGFSDANYFVEIINGDDVPVDLSGHFIRGTDASDTPYRFEDQILEPRSLVQITAGQMPRDVRVSDRLFLFAPDGQTLLDAARPTESLLARSSEYEDRWLAPIESTPGTENVFEFQHDIVINEILYHAPGTETSDTPATFESDVLLPIDANTLWRYRVVDQGLPSDWASTSHSVGQDGWQEGPALIGFERSDLLHPIRTELQNPAAVSPPVITYYFETEFQFDGNVGDDIDLAMRYMIDDGAVFFINGHEFHRFNMADGEFDSETFARPSVPDAVLSEAVAVPTALLVSGTNRISVEVHQASVASNDVVFGLELSIREIISPFIPGQPYTESNEEWIELFNRGNTPVDISGWSLDDAVRLSFPQGTIIEPGSYLLVARDATRLIDKYPDLDGVIAGQFQGTLSNRNESIHLFDQHGNPADEVRYFDGGRWPAFADGGGSSLELIDPDADNGKPEAWAASRESDRSEWQTIRYRDTVTPDGFTNGVTDRFHELIIGMLDAGEVLIDDVSVTEGASERIQNGTFDNDTVGEPPVKWRIGGNHSGVVVFDPDDPANKVLRLTATGAMEDRLNHAETTFANGARIREGAEYEITFRAKWLGGSNQLNSHLFFDRLSKTVRLNRSNNVGTPGRANSVHSANIGPTFESLQHSPTIPTADEPVEVSIEAADKDGIQLLTLWYSVDSGEYNSVLMATSDGIRFQATIPGQGSGDVVQFYVEATDSLGAVSFFPANGRDSRALYQIPNQSPKENIHNFRIVMTPDDANLLHRSTNVMSNGRLGATVIYNEQEVFYDVGVRLKGSNAGRSNSPYLGFNVAFDFDASLSRRTRVGRDRSIREEQQHSANARRNHHQTYRQQGR